MGNHPSRRRVRAEGLLTDAGRRRAVAFLVVDALALVVLAVLVRRVPGNRFDWWWSDRRIDDARLLRTANDVLDVMSSAVAVGPAAFAVARLTWWRWRSMPLSAFVVVAPALAYLLAEHVLKPVVDRPGLTLGPARSWPSGTMAVLGAGATVALLLLGRHHGRVRGADLLGATAAVGVVAACFVATGYHWATDLVGGTGLGVGVALALGAAFPTRATGTS